MLLPSEPFELAVKVIELPKDIHAPCTLQDLYTEVSIMEHLQREARMCHIYDYGVDKVTSHPRIHLFYPSFQECMPVCVFVVP